MTKLLSTLSILSVFFYACGNRDTPSKTGNSKALQLGDTVKNQGLRGTWVRHNREGFTLIEIKDPYHVLFYHFIDRKAGIDTVTVDRYWYYKSEATMGYWNNPDSPI